MGFSFSLLLILASFPVILAQEVTHATISIDGTATVAVIDDNFVCATLDWWPHDKCNYNQCPWGYSSVTNLDLSHPLLSKAIQAFRNLRIRIGGSLQDQVLYGVESLKAPCQPFRKMKGGLFGFSKGCLHMNRWDEMNHLFSRTGAIVTIGLNALYGRHQIRKGVWGGAWGSSNARDFMNYTVSKGYKIDSWEYGNELSGSGVRASVSAGLYGKDSIHLKDIVNNLYKNSDLKPALVAPGGFFDKQWYAKLLEVSGSGIVNYVTHHIYNLGAGMDPNLVNKILDPHYLSKVSETFSNLSQTIQQNGPWASAWVGESGGAYNSGGRHVSDTFVNSFWYLDQLGMASRYNTKVYCRQTLVGGNYGLLNTTTLVPNPDYYSALLWHRLMGKGVLAVGSNALPFLRSYARCSKGRVKFPVILFLSLVVLISQNKGLWLNPLTMFRHHFVFSCNGACDLYMHPSSTCRYVLFSATVFISCLKTYCNFSSVVERCSSTNVATQRLVGLVLAAAIYHIWQEQNRRIYDHHFSSVERTREAIMYSIRTKLSTLDVGDDLPASLLQAWDIQ